MTRRRHLQTAIEDTLKHLHECEYEGGSRLATAESVAGALGCGRNQAVPLLERMAETGLLQWRGDGVGLTDEGRVYARQVIRAHRLYETYLARQTGVGPGDWHALADRIEHGISTGEADALAKQLGYPRFDPHGDPIPTRHGVLPAVHGLPLQEFSTGESGRILHVADEPEAIGRRLAADGFAPGMRVEVLDAGPRGLRISLEGRELRLDSSAAALLRVVPLTARELEEPKADRLSRLHNGQEARVLGLSPSCRGPERTRLLDLGFVPGSTVRAVMKGPLGSPVAYRVRGTLIALRPRQSDLVFIERETSP